MSTYNLTQIVDFPTRIAKNSETLLDVLFIDTTIYVNVRTNKTIHKWLIGSRRPGTLLD